MVVSLGSITPFGNETALGARSHRLRREVGEQDDPGVEPLDVIELQVDPPPVAEYVDVPFAVDERVQVHLEHVDEAGVCL
jgi:hypothetical protein